MSNLRSDVLYWLKKSEHEDGSIIATYIKALCFQIDQIEEQMHREVRGRNRIITELSNALTGKDSMPVAYRNLGGKSYALYGAMSIEYADALEEQIADMLRNREGDINERLQHIAVDRTKVAMEEIKHPEAFCLMTYRCQLCRKTEKVWNSRDGVTPFIIICSCKGQMEHILWEKDEFLPDYRPLVGSRIFVDLTREKMEAFRRKQIEEGWDTGEYPINLHFKTKEEALEGLMKSFREGEEPDIVVVKEGVEGRTE